MNDYFREAECGYRYAQAARTRLRNRLMQAMYGDPRDPETPEFPEDLDLDEALKQLEDY